MKHALNLMAALFIVGSTSIHAQDTNEQITQLENKVNQLITMFREQSKRINELSDSILKLQEQLDDRGDFDEEDGQQNQDIIDLDE